MNKNFIRNDANVCKIDFAIVLWLMLLTQSVVAQPYFYSQSLSDMYTSLSESCRIGVSFSDTLIYCDETVRGENIPVACEFDKSGALVHLGLRFLPGVDTLPVNQTVIRFIERALLSELISNDINRILTGIRGRNISVALNSMPVRASFFQDKRNVINLLKTTSGINIQYDQIQYEVTLFLGSQQEMSFIFPADNELLTGMDKKELDDWFAANLKNHRKQQDRVVIHEYGSPELHYDTVFVSFNNIYRIPQINNDLYYLKTNDKFSLVFDEKLIVETVKNTLLTPFHYQYNINISHRQYGGREDNFEIYSCDFDDFFFDGFDRFFGLISFDGEMLKGTLFFSDRHSNSIHMARVEVEIDTFFSEGKMYMQINSNIPRHNNEYNESPFDETQ